MKGYFGGTGHSNNLTLTKLSVFDCFASIYLTSLLPHFRQLKPPVIYYLTFQGGAFTVVPFCPMFVLFVVLVFFSYYVCFSFWLRLDS